MSQPRYRIMLVEETSGSLVPQRKNQHRRHWRPEPEPAVEFDVLQVLLNSLTRVRRRGHGPSAWAPVFDNDPLAFLLDSISDAFVVRGMDDRVIFDNPLARELRLGERRFSLYEEFEVDGEQFLGRGMKIDLPAGQLRFTVVSRRR